MRSFFLLLLCVLCCAARAEFPPDSDVESAIDSSRDDDADRNNPFAGTPDEDEAPPKRLNPRTRMKKKNDRRLTRDGREIDSDEEGESEETVTVPVRRAAVVRLGFYGGFTKLANSDSTLNSARSDAGLTSTFPLGLTADVRAWRYLGLDVDGYYSIAPTQNIISSGGGGTTPTSGTKQIQVSGFSAMVKAIYPFDRGNTRWYPSIGAGYGYHQLKHTEASGTATVVDQMSNTAPVIGGGLMVESGKNWLVNIDVQAGVGGTGDVNETGSASPFDNVGNGKFLRARLGVSYQVVPHFFLGGTLLYRSMEVDFTTVASTASTAGATQPTGAPETQLTFVATAQYSF